MMRFCSVIGMHLLVIMVSTIMAAGGYDVRRGLCFQGPTTDALQCTQRMHHHSLLTLHSSVRPVDLGSTVQNSQRKEEPKSSSNSHKGRFVHPQVIKMYRRASELIKAGDNVVAKKLLLRCVELNQFDSHSWLALARLEAKTGHMESAKEIFAKAASLCPNNVHILHAWGNFEQRHGSADIARSCWSTALKIEPHNAYVCYALSKLEQRQGNSEGARNILANIVQKQPTATLCVELANMETKLGHKDAARNILLDGLQRCRADMSILYLALAWLEEDAFHNIPQAQEYLQRALEIDPSNVRVHIAKASLELRQGNINVARETLRLATTIRSEDGPQYTMWSTLELEAGNLSRAREIIEEGAQRYPGDHFLLQRYASLEAKYGNRTKAKALFERSVLVKPHAPSFVAWAILEEEEGNEILRGRLNNFHSMASNRMENDFVEEKLGMLIGDDRSFAHDNTSSSNLVDPKIRQLIRTYAASQQLANENPVAVTSSHENIEMKDNALSDSKSTSSAASETQSAHLSLTERKRLAEAKFQAARELFTVGMEADPLHGPVYHAYGNMELRRGNHSAARAILLRGIAQNCSDLSSVYHALGLLETKLGHLTEAQTSYEHGIRTVLHIHRLIDPGLAFLFHSLGMLHLDNRHWDAAYAVFREGLSVFPDHPQLLLGLALVSMKRGEYKAARAFFVASTRADAHHFHAWQAWAIAEKQMGHFDRARVLFKEGLRHGPQHGPLWQAFAVMEMKLGNNDVARQLLTQAIARAPHHAQSYQAWACLEAKLGHLDVAKRLAWQGILHVAVPQHAPLWTIAGLVEWRMGQVDAAREILTAAIKQFPSHGPLYRVLGELEISQQQIDCARAVLAEGLQRDPQYAATYHAAALLEARLGNLEKLSELHYRAKELFSRPDVLSAASATAAYSPQSTASSAPPALTSSDSSLDTASEVVANALLHSALNEDDRAQGENQGENKAKLQVRDGEEEEEDVFVAGLDEDHRSVHDETVVRRIDELQQAVASLHRSSSTAPKE